MNPEKENIEALSRAILGDARAEAEQMQLDAKAKADAIHRLANEQAAAERKAILEHASTDAERLRGQVIATAQLKARTLQLEHREKLLDKVFDAARQKISSIQKRSDYDQIVAQLLREAVIQLKASGAEVRADEATMKSLKAHVLEQVAKELNAQLSTGKALENGLGVVVDASEGRLHYDNTFETRLNRL